MGEEVVRTSQMFCIVAPTSFQTSQEAISVQAASRSPALPTPVKAKEETLQQKMASHFFN